MPNVISYALSGARFPGSYSFKVYNEEWVRPFFYEAGQMPDLAFGYFVAQLFTSGYVPQYVCRDGCICWTGTEVAANSRIVGNPEVILLKEGMPAHSIIQRGGFMPGWGSGSFENDDARNFLGRLNSVGVDDLKQMLVDATDREYPEAPESSIVIAAAEIVATARGNHPEAVPSQIVEWVSKIDGAPSPEMLELARLAVYKVRTNSELKDLWLEAEGIGSSGDRAIG
jgi:hypothetical protein